MSHLAHIADRLLNTPLLITPEKAQVIAAVLGGRIGLDELSRFEGSPVVIDAQGNPKVQPFNVKDGTAIITIAGSLVNRGAWVGASSGLTSYEGIQHQLKTALADPAIKNVILDINSPGGEAIGAFETAAMVRELAAKKPVTAIVNGMAASAAYAIASGASEIVTTESGVSGSIGVISLHVDQSRALENEGLKPTLIFAGAHKADGNPFGPLPDAVKADFQARVDSIYAQFLKTVEAGRGASLTTEKARATEARTLIGQAAVDAGLADAVGTFESVLADLSRGARRSTTSMKGKSMTEANSGPAAETNAGIINKADLDAAVSKATADASSAAEARIKADRERMAAIDELAAKIGADDKAGQKIIADAKISGASAGDTALALIKADSFKKAAVLGAIQQDDASAAGAKPAAPGNGPAPVAQTPEGWKAEYAGSAKLQAEFGSEASYVAFMKANAAGQVKILSGRAAA